MFDNVKIYLDDSDDSDDSDDLNDLNDLNDSNKYEYESNYATDDEFLDDGEPF
jgi:hypothetical protein